MCKIGLFFKSIKWAEIPVATYVRYVLMILTVVNTVLNWLGINPIQVDEENLYRIISDVITTAVLIVNTWCNNSITEQAIETDKIMKDLKEQRKTDPVKYAEHLNTIKDGNK